MAKQLITKKDLDVFNKAVKENFVSEKDKKVFLYCWSLLKYGWKKHKQIAKELNLTKKADRWFDNLKKSGYIVEDGKIAINLGKYADIEFAIMMSVAEGYIKRSVR